MTRTGNYKRGPEHYAWKGDAAREATKRERIQKSLPLGKCQHEDCEKWATDRHHIDGDTGNNDLANIRQFCRRHHMEEDGRLDAFRQLARRNAAKAKKSPPPCIECGSPKGYRRYGRCHACDERGRRGWAAALRGEACISCLATWGLVGHHVIEKAHLRDRYGALGAVWDVRNLAPVCSACHERHHTWGGTNRLELALLRDENFLFAAELLGPPAAFAYLRRHYRGTDRRLDALLLLESPTPRRGR